RQSCIYGQYQHGNADQGWVVHFLQKAMAGGEITIYGDGKQVRDILHVNDLINAYMRVLKNQKKCAGRVFNIGGGTKNSFSLLELIRYLEKLTGKEIKYKFESWRPGDQKIFISNNNSLKKATGWKPKIGKEQGIRMVIEWLERKQ
ncbi:MAG: GDP-mannose 4,6-dehydratase, partial [Candidatus Omnitrophica bacterium]|nr:GDP-mannose 4,6-dehydratase [Candidatus Omnitrophota bacterium]